MLIKFSEGPLAGQEKDVADADRMSAEYPGYSPIEQVMDPERGQILTAAWTGDETTEAHYANERYSDAERERYGNETGVRDPDAQDRMRGTSRTSTTSDAEPGDRASGETTGAQKRDAKNEASGARRRGSESRETGGRTDKS